MKFLALLDRVLERGDPGDSRWLRLLEMSRGRDAPLTAKELRLVYSHWFPGRRLA